MPEVVTKLGSFELTEFEQEHAVEVQDIVALIPGSKGFVKRMLADREHLEYDRVVWLISQSNMLQVYLGIEIQKCLDEAEGLIADILDGTVKATAQRFEAAKWYLKQKGRSRGYTDGKTALPVGGLTTNNFQINFVGPEDTDKPLLVTKPAPVGRPKRRGSGAAPEITFVDGDTPPPPQLI